MSMEELTLRYKIHKNIKLFLQEKQVGTLDKIIYGEIKYNRSKGNYYYPRAYCVVFDRLRNIHISIEYNEVLKYFNKDRKEYLILQERARTYLTALRNNSLDKRRN